MKAGKRPYNIEVIKEYLNERGYKDFEDINYTTYKKVFKFIYPNLTIYYLEKLIQDLVDDGYMEYEKQNNRRYFRVKHKKKKVDIGYIVFE